MSSIKLNQSDEVEEVIYGGRQQLQTGAIVVEVCLAVPLSRYRHGQNLAAESGYDVVFFKVGITLQFVAPLIGLEVCEPVFIKFLHDATIDVFKQLLLLLVSDLLILQSLVFEGLD